MMRLKEGWLSAWKLARSQCGGKKKKKKTGEVVEEESAGRRRQIEEAEETKGEQQLGERGAAVKEMREVERNKRWGDDGVGEEE